MAAFKLIATVQPAAASNTSLSVAFKVPQEFTHFAIQVPDVSTWAVTATCAIKILVSDSQSGTYYTVGWSANPATATTGIAAEDWSTGNAPGLHMVLCEALQTSPGWAKLQFVRTATASADFKIYGRKFD